MLENPLGLKLNEKAKNLEEVFPTITKERIHEIIDSVQKLADESYKNTLIQYPQFFTQVLLSDIAQTPEEMAFTAMFIGGLAGQEVQREKTARNLAHLIKHSQAKGAVIGVVDNSLKHGKKAD